METHAWLAFALALLSCGPRELPEPSPTADPFRAASTVGLEHPGRALAGTRVAGTTALLVAREFESDVFAMELLDGSWNELGSFPVPQGPRAICALRETVMVASTSASELSRLVFDGENLALSWSVELESAPSSVACADVDGDGTIDALVSVGQAEQTRIVTVHGDDGEVIDGGLAPHVSAMGAGDLDDDGDADGLAISTTAGSLTLLINTDGLLSVDRTIDLGCSSPRAGRTLRMANGAMGAAIACDGAVVVVSDMFSSEAKLETITAAARLYDLAIVGDSDGAADGVATVGIESHELAFLAQAEGEWSLHDVARGPIALVAFDVEDDGDNDLIVLSLEQARLSLFQNESR